MSYEYIRETYKVPAEYGREVIQDGRKGVIVGCKGQYLEVNFYDKKNNHVSICHPTYEIEYLGMGKIRPLTKGQLKYQRYIDTEYPGTFAEFLGIRKKDQYHP